MEIAGNGKALSRPTSEPVEEERQSLIPAYGGFIQRKELLV
jgi:hypothetical protein